MKTFYNVKTVWMDEDEKGKAKKVRESYLIEAVSPTDAEAITTKEYGTSVSDFEVLSITKTNYVDVLLSNE